MPNRSKRPQTSFEFTTEDLRIAMDDWFDQASPGDEKLLALWHTHPMGGVGPSRNDMRSRVHGATHLVVAITEEGPIPTWY